MGQLIFDQKERVGQWVADRVEQSASWGSFYAMGAERDGELVAGIVLNNYNGANATAHICCEKPGKDLLALIEHFFRYAFVQCPLQRVTVMVPAALPKVLAFVKKLGFEDEFVMKQGAADSDMVFVVMWRDKCPWLKGN